jgi:hypothetical protein
MLSEDRSTVTAHGTWQARIVTTCPEDIGRITAELIFRYPEITGVVHAAGDSVTAERMANVVESVTGKKVERKLKTLDQLKAELKEDPEDHMRRYRVVFAEGKGTSWPKEGSFNDVKGIKTESVEEWARKNL